MSSHFQLVAQVAENIENNIAEEINIALLASELGLSPWHFQRLFKSIVGDSLGNYLRGRRLTKGAELLIESELDIIDIAAEVGFNSHEAFTRSFKKQFEITPKQYRKVQPKTLLQRKPRLNQALQDFIFNGIEREPEIKVLPTLCLSGYETSIPSPFHASETMCESIFQVWTKLMGERADLGPKNFAGVSISPSGNYTEEEIQFLAAEVLTDSDLAAIAQEQNPARQGLSIETQQVAMFKINIDLNEDNVGRTIDYIYGYWLPNSKYSRGHGHDYEYFQGVVDFSQFDQFEYYYVVPIKEA